MLTIAPGQRWRRRVMALWGAAAVVLVVLATQLDGVARWLAVGAAALTAFALLSLLTRRGGLGTSLDLAPDGLTVRRGGRSAHIPGEMVKALGLLGPERMSHLAVWVDPADLARLQDVVAIIRPLSPRTSAGSAVIPLLRGDTLSAEQLAAAREFAERDRRSQWRVAGDVAD